MGRSAFLTSLLIRLRSGNKPCRRSCGDFHKTRVTRLRAVEPLEDRLLLDAALFQAGLPDPADPLLAGEFAAWRQLSFSIGNLEDLPAAPPEASSSPAEAGSTDMPLALPQAEGTEQVQAHLVHQSYGYTGRGYAVAIIDSGIDYRHPDLAANYLGGWDFVDRDADPLDANGHGTHVAGIVAGRHALYGGVAPEAGLVALRVLDADGSGDFGAIYDALLWVANNALTYNIVAVNLSLGDGGHWVSNPYPDFLASPLTQLLNRGIFVAVAAGNAFNQQPNLAYPAIDDHVVAVGAVYTDVYGPQYLDTLTNFSQRSEQLELLAPGAAIYSTWLGGGYASLSGTSMAAPFAAGAAALLHQAYDAAGFGSQVNQAAILQTLRSRGVSVYDPVTRLTFPRLDVYAAFQSIAPPLGDVDPATSGAPSFTALFRQGAWFFDGDGRGGTAERALSFGVSGDTPLLGDWTGDGQDDLAIFRAGQWFFDLDGAGRAAERAFSFGVNGDVPVVGDWNGDGVDDAGIFRGGLWFFDTDGRGGTAESYRVFGLPGDIPVVGDWNGDGRDDVGVFRGGLWYLDADGRGGAAESHLAFGVTGDVPVAGDWTGDGKDDVGIFRRGQWFFDTDGRGGAAERAFAFGLPGDRPLAGVWPAPAAAASSALSLSFSEPVPSAQGEVLSAWIPPAALSKRSPLREHTFALGVASAQGKTEVPDLPHSATHAGSGLAAAYAVSAQPASVQASTPAPRLISGHVPTTTDLALVELIEEIETLLQQ